jgi:peptidoglycan/xylan/chitin deacetylase (PgdA/CDA1 family)
MVSKAGWQFLVARFGFRWLAAQRRQRLSILIFHRVLTEPDPLRPGDPCEYEFRQQMQAMARVFNVLPMGEAVDRLQKGTLPSRAAAITFDDGYADNATVAWPVLNELGLPATVFVATGFLNGGRMFNDTVIEAVRALPCGAWNLADLGVEGAHGHYRVEDESDRRDLIARLLPVFKYALPEQRNIWEKNLAAGSPRPLPKNLMMTDDQVVKLARNGIEIGAHTVSHPILKSLSAEDAHAELANSKAYLEGLTGDRVGFFAYPNGRPGDDYLPRHAQLAESLGFRAAVSTQPGTGGPESDLFQLPRFTPWDRTPARFLARLGLNLLGRIH